MQNLARIASFEGLLVSVKGFDSLTGKFWWKNINLPVGEWVWIGYILGHYDSATSTFEPMYWGDSQHSVWGTHRKDTAIGSGENVYNLIKTFANNVLEEVTLDALAFVTAYGEFDDGEVQIGGEWRVCGLSWVDFQALPKYAIKVFQNVVTVTPYGG